VLDYSEPGLQLYGFYRTPALDCFVNWSESRVLSISHESYKVALRFSVLFSLKCIYGWFLNFMRTFIVLIRSVVFVYFTLIF
jgi:hypothetical protein